MAYRRLSWLPALRSRGLADHAATHASAALSKTAASAGVVKAETERQLAAAHEAVSRVKLDQLKRQSSDGGSGNIAPHAGGVRKAPKWVPGAAGLERMPTAPPRRGYSGEEIMGLEDRYGAHNYHPLPVVLERGEGCFVYDTDGKRYFDCLSAYSAVNQGHCHPKIIQALYDQASRMTLTSRAFYSTELGPYEKFACEFFGFEKLLP
jgi:hypothetical protein